MPLTQTIYPGFASIQGDPARLAAAYQRAQALLTAVALPAGIGTAVVPHSDIAVQEPEARLVSIKDGATVADLIGALRSIHLSTRDVITILQSIKAAGALHGELIIQ